MATTVDHHLSRPGPVGQTEIDYTPGHETYLARIQKRQKSEYLKKSLPPGFLSKLDSDLVWDGRTVCETYEGLYKLSESELKEVDEALQHFQGLKKPLGFVNQQTLPLPTLHAALRSISKELHFGHGFKVIRGIPTRKYSHEENFTIYAGVASHIAPVRGRQDNSFKGEPADVVLGHIKNLSHQVSAVKIGSPAYTSEAQVFQTDYGDMVGLLALSAAAEGDALVGVW